MDKKDIYEHLAKIYLDASSKRKKKTKVYSRVSRNLFLASIIFIFSLGSILLISPPKNKSFNSEVTLMISADVLKINFNFNPAKKEIYSVNLNTLNLNRFKTLAFSAKRANYQDKLSLRVEFTNKFKEKSEVYLKDIPHKWRDYKIDFSEFKNISDWSEMLSLAFVVEEWNTKEKKGILYLDNVRFIK